ncbi:DUF2007 domain-containing protein [bacterium]|nr:DUF2007 domain-containing protein [bacterium]
MRCVYSAADPVNAEILKDYLESYGIDIFVDGAHGWGGRGELAADAYPRLFVKKDIDEARAKTLIAQWEAGDDPRPDWTCAACGERLAGSFTDCWQCGAERP